MLPRFKNGMNFRAVACTIVLVVAWLAPTAEAHAAPDPPDYMTRLLHDYNDDWGGDQAGSRDGHDVMALDIQEAYNSTFAQDVLVFRLTLNGGYTGSERPELREVLTFQAKGAEQSKEFRTLDNVKFTGSFDAVNGPFPALTADGSQDGTRFYLEGSLKASTLGLKAGDKISNFFVQGYAGSDKRDHMVGGYTIGGQALDQAPPEEQSQPASYKRQDYAIAGPTQYASLAAAPTQVTAKSGENKSVVLTIKNKLIRAQTITLDATKPAGTSVAFHADNYRKDRTTFALASRQEATVHMYLTSASAASGTVQVVLATDLGGRATQEIQWSTTGGGTSRPTTGSAAHSTPDSPDEDAPSVGVALLLMVLLAVAVIQRPGHGRK